MPELTDQTVNQVRQFEGMVLQNLENNHSKNRRVGGGGSRGLNEPPLKNNNGGRKEEKLLNKVPVVEIHQPKKNRDINPFFKPYVSSSEKKNRQEPLEIQNFNDVSFLR